MGKPTAPCDNRKCSVTMINVTKQRGVHKRALNVTSKRLLMMQRRISNLIIERTSMEQKNKDLADALKAEKLITSAMKKEAFHWKRLYHESAIAINSYKVKQSEVEKCLANCLTECNSLYPNLVAVSSVVTSNKMRITNMINSLSSSEHKFLPYTSQEKMKLSTDHTKREKPMKHKVGPMVKGVQVYTKPKIVIERLAWPQPQDEDPAENVDNIVHNNDAADVLSPIREEAEDSPFRNVSMRPKRSKLGTLKFRRQEKLKQEEERMMEAELPYNGDTSDSEPVESQPTQRDQLVVNFGPSTHQVESSSKGEVSGSSRLSLNHNVAHTTDDPLEGSSWMYNNRYTSHVVLKKQNRTCGYMSDSSDRESVVSVRNMPTSNSSSSHGNKQCYINLEECSPNVTRKSSVSSVLKEQEEELHSTSIVDHQITSSPELSMDYGSLNNSLDRKEVSVRLSSISIGKSSARNSDVHSTLRESWTNEQQTDSRDSAGKRSRKPNHRYLTEDYLVPSKPKFKIPVTVGRQSLTKIKQLKRRSRESLSDNEEEFAGFSRERKTVGGKRSKTGKPSKKKSSTKYVKASSPNFSDTEKPSINNNGEKDGKRRDQRKTKGSTSKHSQLFESPPRKQSSDNNQGTSGRPKRAKSGVNYKEPPINTKKRQP